jgi:hypothetical protein
MIAGNRYREICNKIPKYSDPGNWYIEERCEDRYCISSGKMLKISGA